MSGVGGSSCDKTAREVQTQSRILSEGKRHQISVKILREYAVSCGIKRGLVY